jgi:hypothetical protein
MRILRLGGRYIEPKSLVETSAVMPKRTALDSVAPLLQVGGDAGAGGVGGDAVADQDG